MHLLSGISLALNDPQWSRGSGSGGDDGDRDEGRRAKPPAGGAAPDLDELWRELNRRLNGLLFSLLPEILKSHKLALA